jgi:hypothetical protein
VPPITTLFSKHIHSSLEVSQAEGARDARPLRRNRRLALAAVALRAFLAQCSAGRGLVAAAVAGCTLRSAAQGSAQSQSQVALFARSAAQGSAQSQSQVVLFLCGEAQG